MSGSYSSAFLRLFSRVTSDKRRYIPEIDGFRFFAIATVFFFHAGTHLKRSAQISFIENPENSWLNWITSRGGMGVDVFFAISGFILALPFAKHAFGKRKKVTLKDYYYRRLTRLEPPYIITLVLFFAIQLILGIYTWKEGAPHFLASLFYSHNVLYDQWSTINPVAWSLEVEVQFYLLAPFLFLVFKISNKSLRRGIIFGSIFLLLGVNDLYKDLIEEWNLRKSILVYLSTFGLGILVADVYILDKDFFVKKRWVDVLGVIGLIFLYVFSFARLDFFLEIGFHIGIFLLFLSVLFGNLIKRFFSIPAIAIIGGMCYTIYLLHYAIIALVASLTKDWFTSQYYELYYLFQTTILAIVVLVASGIFFFFIEKPCMRSDWPRRLLQKIGWKKKKDTHPEKKEIIHEQ